MERTIEIERYRGDQRILGTSGRISLSHSSRSVKQQERFKQKRHSFSYGEIHREVANDANDSSCKASINHHEDDISGNIIQNDEIVKYMSNLPSYLERGKNLQEKFLSVGVLDWGRLEKWQSGHKQISPRSRENPPIRSDGLSSSCTESPSPKFWKYHSSPSRQRLHRPTLYSHIVASPYSDSVKSFRESDEKCHDREFLHINTLNGVGKFIQREQHFYENNLQVIKQSERKDPESNILQECKTLPGGLNYEVPSSQCAEFTAIEISRAQDSIDNDRDVLENTEAVDLLPGNSRKNKCAEDSKLSDSTSLSSHKSEEASQKNLMGRSMVSFSAELKSNSINSSNTLCEVDPKQFMLKQNCSKSVLNTSCSSLRSVRAGFSPSKTRILEAKAPVAACSNSMVKEASSGVNLKASTVTVSKVRSSSPFSRLSIGLGRRSNSSSSNPDSTRMSVKSGSENTKPLACLNDSSIEKSSSTGRASSSPLRRLLDPLLKPKVAVSRHAIEPLQKDMEDKAYNRQSDSTTVQARKLKLDMSRCKKINVNDSALDKKHGPSVIHALLQVAFKNGLPLFTFAVDNVPNILAATVKLNSSRKEKSSHIYTFFSVQEVKKKNGSWINQGRKGKGRDYISNVIAQMKVSESQISHLTKPGEPSLREFVLISVDLRDSQTSDFQPNEELAAIVVKFPPKKKLTVVEDNIQRNACNYLPEDDSRECYTEGKSFPCSNGSVLVQQPAVTEAFISITVLLPSGVHSLPSKGGPSSLIERRNSGGSCDCGGWDLGCKLRVLSNQNVIIEKSSSESPPMMGQFKLFPEEGVPENHCVLSLAAFKDTIYSVEFNSSVSLLQAFSICLAMIDSRNSYELSESSILFEARTSAEAKLVNNDRLIPNLAAREVSAEHITCPPLSPFGRV